MRSELSVLQVETTNICNAKCVFCPHDKIEGRGTMSQELYEKIINEAAGLNLKFFIPMLTGEPFCDGRIIERIKLAREAMPEAVIRIFTNGNRLTDDDIDALRDMEKLELWVSVNAASPETRKNLMRLDDYEEVVGKVHRMEMLGMTVVAYMVNFPVIDAKEIDRFLHTFKTPWLGQFNNFAGAIYPYRRSKGRPCSRALHEMTVMWDGRVSLCCFDPFGQVIFGDLKTQSIEEIWNSRTRQEYKMRHVRGEGYTLPLCSQCTDS